MNIIDFTKKKLVYMEKQHSMVGDELMADILWQIIQAYREGIINITWEEGMPIPIENKEAC